jgi:hypothetical protein
MAPGIRDHLSQASAELDVSMAAVDRAIATLKTALEACLQQSLNALPEPSAPISEHRREHRSGPTPKIAADPELQAFITARLDRLTFEEIAAEIAQHFPASRRVGRTTIWQ